MTNQPGEPWAPEAIKQAIEETVAQADLVLEEVQVKGGSQPVVQVVVDLAHGTEAVDLDSLAEVSRQVGEVLDAGLLEAVGPYKLELSSPGATRPLTEPRHFQRNIGRVIAVVGQDEDFKGTILEADDAGILIEPIRPAPKKGMKAKVLEPVRREYSEILRAKVDVEATAAARAAEPTAQMPTDTGEEA